MTFLPMLLLLPLTLMAFKSTWVVRAKAGWATLLAIFVYAYFKDLGAAALAGLLLTCCWLLLSS